MYTDDAPDVTVRLSATLSQEAMRAALRRGKIPTEEVSFEITPDSDLWARVPLSAAKSPRRRSRSGDNHG